MNETEKFLNEFRRLEKVLKETKTADSVPDYENSLQTSVDDIYDKLKMCRITRNFLSHHANGSKFIMPTTEMTKFIKELSDKLESQIQHIKDVMTRQKTVTMDTSIKDVLTALSRSKFGWLAITDKEGRLIGIIDKPSMTDLLAKKQSLTGKLSSILNESDIKKILKSCYTGITSPDDRAEDIYKNDFDRIVVCRNGIYKGIVK